MSTCIVNHLFGLCLHLFIVQTHVTHLPWVALLSTMRGFSIGRSTIPLGQCIDTKTSPLQSATGPWTIKRGVSWFEGCVGRSLRCVKSMKVIYCKNDRCSTYSPGKGRGEAVKTNTRWDTKESDV